MNDVRGAQRRARAVTQRAYQIFKPAILNGFEGMGIPAAPRWPAEANRKVAPAVSINGTGVVWPSEQQLRLILENTSDSVFVFSMARELIYLNAAVERLTGYTREEIVARKFINWIHPDDQAAMLGRWEDLYAGKAYENVEFRLVTKAGIVKWSSSAWGPLFDERGIQIGVQGRERDITELKRGEEARRELAAIVESSEDAIFSMTLDGMVVSWNRAAARIYGYDAREMTGNSAARLLSPACAEKMAAVLRDVAEGRTVAACEVLHHRKDGTEVAVSLTISPVRGAAGEVSGVSVIARDVTERNRLQNQVIESCMSERRRIGHELHDGLAQYMTGLTFRAKALEQSLEDQGAPSVTEAKELGALIAKAASLTRGLARGQDPAGIENLGLEKALQILTVETEALFGVRCEFKCGVSCDRLAPPAAVAFFRVLQEAIHNAVRHGEATLIQAEVARENGHLCLRICDDGVGFDVEAKRGEGMGLRIMGYRARSIGADLKIVSNQTGGTRIECRLPTPG